MAWYGVVWCGMAWCGMVQYSIVYGMVHNNSQSMKLDTVECVFFDVIQI